MTKGRANGYEVAGDKLLNPEPMSWAAPFAGGSICSTVLDLVRFESALEAQTLFSDALLQCFDEVVEEPSTLEQLNETVERLSIRGVVGEPRAKRATPASARSRSRSA